MACALHCTDIQQSIKVNYEGRACGSKIKSKWVRERVFLISLLHNNNIEFPRYVVDVKEMVKI